MVRDALDRMVLERYSYPPGVSPIPAAVAAEERW
jgi:hypothetical protein